MAGRFHPYASHSTTASEAGTLPFGCLKVLPFSQFEKYCKPKPTAYQQPKEFAYFSYDEHRNLHMMSRQELKYYYRPSLHPSESKTDQAAAAILKERGLSSGFQDKFVKRDPIPEHLDSLLKAVQEANAHQEIKAQFCTWRGIITKIMCAPYSTRDEWELNVCKYQDTIYMEESENPSKDAYGQSEKDQLMTYWGYKFETISTIPKPPAELDQDDPVLLDRMHEVTNTNVQFCSVFRTRIGPHSIIMGGEVDCIYSDNPLETPQKGYCELKTNRVISNERQRQSFEKFKLLRVWVQSFLAGVSKIVVGFRDDDGFLSHLEEFKTLEIPRIVREKGYWDHNVCLGFTERVLAWLQDCLKNYNSKDIVFKLKFQGSKQQLILEGPNNKCFIPDWYN